MIIPDINLLIYAYNTGAKLHGPSKEWLEEILSGDKTVGFSWAVLHGYIRLTTHPSVMKLPLEPSQAVSHVASWLKVPHTAIIEPGKRHLEILSQLLNEIGSAGNITTDAVLAALAIEYQGELHSNDGDFSRFSGLRWVNPVR